jgi:sugar-specific transcriptional regulator TrmB
MEPEELMEAGLTLNQAVVYLELVKHPGQSGGQVSKKVSIDRSFVYNIINSLIDKGLLSSVIRENVRTYYPSNPENLSKEIEEKRTKINTVVGKLKRIRQGKKEEILVKTYEGKAGLKSYVRELLASKSFETFGGGGNLAIFDILKYEFPHYSKELRKKKIKGRLITSDANKDVMKVFKNSDMKIKTLKKLKNDVNFVIFEDKLSIYSAEDKPYVIVIENKKIADSLRDYFDNLWKLL